MRTLSLICSLLSIVISVASLIVSERAIQDSKSALALMGAGPVSQFTEEEYTQIEFLNWNYYLNHKKSIYKHSNRLYANAVIGVYSCKHKDVLIDLYQDKDAIVHIPNPFLADGDGHYQYFATARLVEETVSVDGRILDIITSCEE